MAIFRGTDTLGYDQGDYITGTELADNIKLYAGDDGAAGNGGNDSIGGGSGNDSIVGGDGDDRIWGGAGNDYLSGDNGADQIWGGAGDDRLVGDGEPGRGADTLHGDSGNDTIYGNIPGTVAWGDSGNDYIFATGGAQHGGTGNDSLGTGSIYDEMGASADVTMEGGRGADNFYDAAHMDGIFQHTTVTDFDQSVGDRLTLNMLVDTPQDGGFYIADTATVFSWLDSNHDGQVTALQADGTGDVAARSDGANLDLFLMDDTLTLQHTTHLDWSMVA